MQEISSIVKLNHLSSSEKKGNFLKARSDKSINVTSSFIGPRLCSMQIQTLIYELLESVFSQLRVLASQAKLQTDSAILNSTVLLISSAILLCFKIEFVVWSNKKCLRLRVTDPSSTAMNPSSHQFLLEKRNPLIPHNTVILNK